MNDLDKSAVLSRALIALMKGVVYEESDSEAWQGLLGHTARVRDYVCL